MAENTGRSGRSEWMFWMRIIVIATLVLANGNLLLRNKRLERRLQECASAGPKAERINRVNDTSNE